MNPNPLSPETGQKALRALWQKVQQGVEPRPTLDASITDAIDLLVRQQPPGTKAFRYALLTQVLAVYLDPQVDIFALQVRATTEPRRKSFDARSFCKSVVVPFERDHWGNLLGGSPDPYVSKPLRKPRLEREDPSIRNQEAYRALWTVLEYMNQGRDDEAERQSRARMILVEILHQIYSLLQQRLTPPPLPENIPLDTLMDVVEAFCNQPSLGGRPQYLLVAFLEAFNALTGLYGNIIASKATEADRAKERLGDIEIRDKQGVLKLVIAVTTELTCEKLREEIHKAQKKQIPELLIISVRMHADVASCDPPVSSPYVRWTTLTEYLRLLIWTIDADIRPKFVAQLYKVLSHYGETSALFDWDALIRRHFGSPNTSPSQEVPHGSSGR